MYGCHIFSWYVLGGMSLTCLPIFAWQWGRKHNNTEKNVAFWVKPHFCLFLWQHGLFSFIKVCIFLPMVFIGTFITTLCFYDFCNSVGKKMHTLPRCGLIFPFQMPYFFTGFSVVLYLHNWSPLKPQNKLQKKSRALPWAPTGAYTPRTLRTQVLKNWPPSQLVFAVHTSPKSERIYTGFLTCLA